jgi:membrane protein implicated in regulation of membrane protease activity
MSVAIGLALIAVLTVGVLLMFHGVGFFAPSRRPKVEFDPEVLTGHVARVTAAIGAAAGGAVAYTLEGRRHDMPAISLDGSPIQAGADVVIERIEGGLAFVEPWEAVEGRI